MNWHMHWYTNTYRWRLGNCWAGHVFTTCSLFSTECNTPKIVCSMVIGTIRIRIDHPRSLRSWYIKWINQSFPRVDSSVPLMWCLSRSFQWNTHRFVSLYRHLIEHDIKLVEFQVNCFLNRISPCIVYRVLPLVWPQWYWLDFIQICPGVLVRKTIWVTLFRLLFFFWFYIHFCFGGLSTGPMI